MSYPSGITPGFDMLAAAAKAFGWTRAFGIGYNPSIDTGTVPESCWGGNGPYPWMPGLTSLEVVAPGSTQDINATGTGAWQVTIVGVDITWTSISSTINLNGATAVAVPVQFYRINSVRTIAAGSGRKNTVDILVRDAGGGTTRAIILAGKSVARQAAYTVPAGFTLLVPEILLVVDKASGATTRDASLETYFAGPSPAPALLPLTISNSSIQPYNHRIDPPIVVAEKTDFDLPIWRVSDNSSIITAAWNGILKRNEL